MSAKLLGFLVFAGIGVSTLGALSASAQRGNTQRGNTTRSDTVAAPAEDTRSAWQRVSEIPIFKAKIDAHKNDTTTPDEAMQAWREGRLTDRERDQLWNGSHEDYFQDMDYGVTRPENREKLRLSLDPFFKGISADEAQRRTARGRNNWIVWTGGNDRFWDQMSLGTMGTFDLLKTISNDPARVPTVRSNRWDKIGLVNEPGFVENSGYDITRFGLKLDKRTAAADPYENADNYPGVKIGARGEVVTWCAPPGEWKDDGSCKDAHGRDQAANGQRYLRRDRLETGSYYGYATGVVGLRLFPNPAFTDAAARKWNPRRYYEDSAYYNDPALVKPFRVGMACAFCHVGPNPARPPADFNAPKFENLTSNAGAQYFWTDRIFFWNWEKEGGDNVVYQLLRTYRPGALDTSLISSDNINNPRTMNAVYDFPARMMTAAKLGHWERLTGEEKFNKQFDTVPNYITKSSPLNSSAFVRKDAKTGDDYVVAPRVLKDGSDSVGALGALNRVYINIGLYSEEWLQNFTPILGGSKIDPFRIWVAESNSLYWQANANQTPDTGLFFLAATRADKLADTRDVPAKHRLKLYSDPQVTMGKRVFATTCARCHSGGGMAGDEKLPAKAYTFFQNCSPENYEKCWDNYWNYTKTDEFKTEMQQIAMKQTFLKDNFLSTDLRVPVTLLDSNLCSPIAMNGVAGNIWDNFSSSTYKALPPLSQKFAMAKVQADGTMVRSDANVPGGGRGYLRPASLISMWATAPYLGNNTLGRFRDKYYGGNQAGSTAQRLESYDDSIRQLLWPERRSQNPDTSRGEKAVKFYTQWGDELTGIIDVTTQPTFIRIPKALLGRIPGGSVVESAISASRAACAVQQNGGFFSWAGLKAGAEEYRHGETRQGDYLEIGPIPAGVPINLIGNLDLGNGKSGQELKDLEYNTVRHAFPALASAVREIRCQNLQGEAATRLFMERAAEKLTWINKCNDYVVNRGHYFGTKYSPDVKDGSTRELSDAEKEALIQFLKHM